MFLRQARNHMEMVGFSISKNGWFFVCGKSINDNLYPYHVVLTTKPKDRRLRRSAKEKLSYTARRMCSHAFCHVTQNIISFLANSNCFACLGKKTVYLFWWYELFLREVKPVIANISQLSSKQGHSVGACW